MRTYTLTAHTGNENTADNSVASIESAAANGADIVELDVMFTRINKRAVMRHSRPVPKNCPTLKEGFEAIKKTELLVNLDIKDTSHLDAAIALADEMGLKERCFFTGIFEKDVPTVKQQCPGVKYYLNIDLDKKKADDDAWIDSIISMLKRTGAAGMNSWYGGVEKKMCDRIHEAGFEVSVWTVNEFEDYKKYAEMGVDNITTRHPSFEKKLRG